jgi:hypothetical protein
MWSTLTSQKFHTQRFAKTLQFTKVLVKLNSVKKKKTHSVDTSEGMTPRLMELPSPKMTLHMALKPERNL